MSKRDHRTVSSQWSSVLSSWVTSRSSQVVLRVVNRSIPVVVKVLNRSSPRVDRVIHRIHESSQKSLQKLSLGCKRSSDEKEYSKSHHLSSFVVSLSHPKLPSGEVAYLAVRNISLKHLSDYDGFIKWPFTFSLFHVSFPSPHILHYVGDFDQYEIFGHKRSLCFSKKNKLYWGFGGVI